ncbi:WG repeat-containing protein [Massilia violaceinigra]|uniref:WG repeat-containing protein n=1 Tax=Massilia violaceinigra TaxID=2045208 RepID=A0ABY4A671_9BURK|nr:WG repeat-containing protein [Massilia violaceinigra]UOD30280.1 WG repeat-containing protein [Massilia violaceinigra]
MPTPPLLIRNYFHHAGADAELLLVADGHVIAPATPLLQVGQFTNDGRGGMIAAAYTLDGQAGYIDAGGAWLAGPGMEHARAFSADGLARFCEGGLWGYVNLAGERVIAAQYEEAEGFSNGLAAVKVTDDEWRYIDQHGQFAFNGSFCGACEFDALGLAAVKQEEDQPWGYIDRQGQWAIEAQFYRAWPFTASGVAPASADEDEWGLIDSSGEWIVPASFNFIYPFNDDGYAYFRDRDSDDEADGYLDRHGIKVITGGFVSEEMHAGVALDGDRNFITADGPLTFPVNLSWVRPFDDSGYALVRSSDFAPGPGAVPAEPVWGFAHRDGRFVPVPPNALEPLTSGGWIPENEAGTPLTPFLMRDGQIHLFDSEARTTFIWRRENCAGGMRAVLHDHAGRPLWHAAPADALAIPAPFFNALPGSFLEGCDAFEQVPDLAISMLEEVEHKLHALAGGEDDVPAAQKQTRISRRVARVYVSEPHNTYYDFLLSYRAGDSSLAHSGIVTALEQRFGTADPDPDMARVDYSGVSLAWPVQLRQPLAAPPGARQDSNRMWIAVYCSEGDDDGDAWFDVWMDCGASIETLEVASAAGIAAQEADPGEEDEDEEEEEEEQEDDEQQAAALSPYDEWMAEVSRSYHRIEDVPAELMDDALCDAALQQNCEALTHLPAHWQTAERLAGVIGNSVDSAMAVPPWCMTAAGLALARSLYSTNAAWQRADAALSTVPDVMNDYTMRKVWGCLLDPAICLRAVKAGVSLAYIPRWLHSPELITLALGKDIGNIRWIEKSGITADMARHAVSRHYASVVSYIPAAVMTAELWQLAVRTDPSTLRIMAPALRTPEVCAIALEQNENYLPDVPTAMREATVTLLIDSDPGSLDTRRDGRTASRWHHLRAWARLWNNDYHGAIADATLAVQAMPESAHPHYILAHALDEIGEHDAAMREAVLVLSLDSQYRMQFNEDGSIGWLRALAKRAVDEADDATLLAQLAANPGGLANIPRWRVTREMVDLAVGANVANVAFVPKRLMTSALYELALTQDIKRFVQVPTAFMTESLCLCAVKSLSFGLFLVPQSLRTLALCIAAVRHRSTALDHVPAALLDEVRAALPPHESRKA